jgi:hypothetical protein
MKKLVVFGDSFAELKFDDPQWAEILAERMNLPCMNFGCSGSSLGYSFHQFCMYTISGEYDADDVIVFVTTSSTRVYTRDMPTPSLGVLQSQSHSPAVKKWITENLESALWVVDKIYDTKINYELIKTISYLKIWAATHRNSIIVIPAFDNVSCINKQELSKIKPTANFIPLALPGQLPSLYQCSEREYGTNWENAKEINYNAIVSGVDRRTNHFSLCNLSILADMLLAVITSGDISKYDVTRFRQHFLKTP